MEKWNLNPGTKCWGKADGCYVTRFHGDIADIDEANAMEGVTVWERGCCDASLEDGTLGSCAEFHEDVDEMEIGDLVLTGRADQSW